MVTEPIFLQNDDGQITDAHSISAGLDYPGIGPEHSWLHDIGRVNYVSATDEEALVAFQLCARLEGIIPALEPSHALAYLSTVISDMDADDIVILNMCGRGDKIWRSSSGSGKTWMDVSQSPFRLEKR